MAKLISELIVNKLTLSQPIIYLFSPLLRVCTNLVKLDVH